MRELFGRRDFLIRAWQGMVGLLAAAGVWTSWDLLRPNLAAGFGARVKTVSPDAVPENTVLEIPEARAYLTKVNGEVVALSEVCTHLGCRVPFCDSSGSRTGVLGGSTSLADRHDCRSPNMTGRDAVIIGAS